MAHTCVEATVRCAAELGYEVTMAKDATADYSDEEMHAALDINIQNYASAIVTTTDVVESISSLNKPISSSFRTYTHLYSRSSGLVATSRRRLSMQSDQPSSDFGAARAVCAGEETEIESPRLA
jgi:hypothetical protein